MSWPLVKLTEVAEVNPRCPKDIDEDQIVSFVAMASASDAGLLLGEEPKVLKDTKKGFTYFERGDVLLAKITPCFENGKSLRPYQIKNQVGFGSTEFHVVRANSEKLDPTYLFYLLWSDAFRFLGTNAMVGAAGQKRVGTPFLKQLEIPLPPLEEQKRIAAILDKADAIRQKRKQAIDLADEFLRSVFLDMFGDPVTNPKGWNTSTLDELVIGKFQNGAYFPKEQYSMEGVEIVHMSDAFYDYVPRGSMKRVIVGDADLKKYEVNHRDILISRRSLNYEGAAKPSLIEASDAPLLFESSLIRVTPNPKLVNKLYLFSYLSNEIVKEHKIRKYVTGATIKGISQKNLEKVEVLVPPVESQQKFAQIFIKTEKMKTQLHQPLLNRDLFESLSQKAFSGQL